MRKISQTRATYPLGGYHGLECKIYPNGETVIYKPRSLPLEDDVKPQSQHRIDARMAAFRLAIECPQVLDALGVTLGLSILQNFDRVDRPDSDTDAILKESPVRYGLKGITPYGARSVRNACYLLENGAGRFRCVFATVTVPDLPVEHMRRLHESWHKVVEAYRRKLTRQLKSEGLSGESVTVSEFQEKRYERAGVPVLHLHTVFVGKRVDGHWAITTECHDQMWREALELAIGEDILDVSSACNLQRVRKSAEGYLGKYMTKGTKAVAAIVADGFEGWLPKQWWSCSRTLRRRVNDETLNAREFAYWLNDVADVEGSDVWIWHRDVVVEVDDVTKITVARYGRINIRQVAEIRAYYSE